MQITQSTSASIGDLWTGVETSITQAASLEDAAQLLATSVHQTFEESVVLARVFFTVPFLSLPTPNAEAVRQLAESAGAESDLRPTTPVLSLIGTHGQETAWNHRSNSEGHVGIPLISSAFVDAIPMIARLLKELGVPLNWIDTHGSEIIKETVGESAGLFYVEDAGSTTDHEGRKIIAAQDFVSQYNVNCVFGAGGAYPSGQIVVAVVFCRDKFPRETAEQFLSLTESFRNATKELVGNAAIFQGVG